MKELLFVYFDGNIGLVDVVSVCGLFCGYFVKVFY